MLLLSRSSWTGTKSLWQKEGKDDTMNTIRELGNKRGIISRTLSYISTRIHKEHLPGHVVAQKDVKPQQTLTESWTRLVQVIELDENGSHKRRLLAGAHFDTGCTVGNIISEDWLLENDYNSAFIDYCSKEDRSHVGIGSGLMEVVGTIQLQIWIIDDNYVPKRIFSPTKTINFEALVVRGINHDRLPNILIGPQTMEFHRLCEKPDVLMTQGGFTPLPRPDRSGTEREDARRERERLKQEQQRLLMSLNEGRSGSSTPNQGAYGSSQNGQMFSR